MRRMLAGVAGPLALIVLSLALYAPSFGNPLVWDDEIHIEQARTSGLRPLLGRADDQYRRPLVLLSYRLQWRAGIATPASFHLVNALLHGINGALLYLVLVRLGLSIAVAGSACAVFIAHPLQSAAVAYVSGRSDLLAGLFTLAALYVVLGAVAARERRASATAIAVALGVFLAGAAKESGLVAGPLVAGLWCVVATTRQWRRPLLPATALAAAAITALWVHPPALGQALQLGLATRLRAAGTTLLTDLRLLVAPIDLHLDRLTPTGGALSLLAGLGVAAAIGWTVLRALARPRELTVRRFGILALAMSYAPVSNLVPVYPAIADRWVFTPEHFLYAPLAVLAALASAGIARVFSPASLAGRQTGGLAAAAVAAAVATLSIVPVRARQSRLADAETVYRDTLAHSPSPRACFNLGVTLLAGERYDEAVETYERCTTISPNDAGVYAQLGAAYQQAHRPAEAAMAYERAVGLDPGNALAWSNYASLDAQSGAYEAARTKWRKALSLDPALTPARRGLEQLDRLDPSD